MTSSPVNPKTFSSVEHGLWTAAPQTDRRRHPRHSAKWSGCTVTAVPSDRTAAPHQTGALLDLSFSGMCFEWQEALNVGELLSFRLDVKKLIAGVANVEARIRRVESVAPGRFRIGAEFVSSDQAWLGPEEL